MLGLVLVAVISGLCVLVAVLTLRMLVSAYKALIIAFYVSIFILSLRAIVEFTYVYTMLKGYFYYKSFNDLAFIASFTAVFAFYGLLSIAAIILILWLLKQLKSAEIENLFKQKSAPVATETL